MRRACYIGILSYILLTLVSVGCQRTTSRNADSLKIGRIDRLAASWASGGRDSAAMDSMSRGVDFLLEVFSAISGDSMSFEDYAVSRAMEVFQPDVENYLGSVDSIEIALGEVSARIAAELPEARFYEVYGIVTPYHQSVVVGDSILLIGLNHYLGTGYPGYSSFETYRRSMKYKSRIPVDVAEAAVATGYPYVPDENSAVVNRMLYEGALVYSLTRIVPDATVGSVLNYSVGDMELMSNEESAIWDAIVSRRLLYSTDEMDEVRLFSPSPSTSVLNPMIPGMAGRYIGYRIVESYVERHPDVKLEFLLSPEFYNSSSSLIDARYSAR